MTMTASLPHRISRLMPGALARRLAPVWHLVRDLWVLLVRQGGSLSYDGALGAIVAGRRMQNGRRMRVVVRSPRELRRLVQFGQHGARDSVLQWILAMKQCDTLYDVGSANGLEGFFVHHLWGSRIVFIEPFTPSIETILKTIVATRLREGAADRFEVVHAACDSAPSYQKLYMHQLPKPGSTGNSFAALADYCRGGREGRAVAVTQWMSAVSLDHLHYDKGLPPPSHVKIDVDGFENRVMRGAARLLKERVAQSWAIEISGEENRAEIDALMAAHGYRHTDTFVHYPDDAYYTADHIYVREEPAAG